MRLIELGNINGLGMLGAAAGQAFPNGDYIGFAIGPDSLVDLVKLNGFLVAPGRILPLKVKGAPTVEAVRGRRTGALAGTDVNVRCQILAYECGDTLLPPGERAPLIRSHLADYAAVANYTRALRLPFAGRRCAQFAIEQIGTVGQAVDYIIQGVKYFAKDLVDSAIDGNAILQYEPHIAEQVIGTVTNLPATANADALSTIGYVGGVDSEENFDELELWLRRDGSSGNADIIVHAEAWGER